MMQEILFKAKRIDNGEWVEGFYMNIGGKYHYILEGWIDITHGYPDLIKVAVNPKTVCRYTGLTDKNDNKIFENDICSADLKRPYNIVEFRNGCFMYNINDGGEDYYDIMTPIEPLVYSDKFTEVIGNIFDNPELMEV